MRRITSGAGVHGMGQRWRRTREPQGEGRVAAVVDGRSLALKTAAKSASPASRVVEPTGPAESRLVRHRRRPRRDAHGEDDSPDRYGRQGAFVFVTGSEHSVQSELLRRGEALLAVDISEKIAPPRWPSPRARREMPNWVFGPTLRP